MPFYQTAANKSAVFSFFKSFAFCLSCILFISVLCLCLHMAPGSLFDGEPSDATFTSQAADLCDDTIDMSDQLFNMMTSNVKECDYIDTNASNQIVLAENDSLNLIHLNIRSLNAIFNDLHVFICQLSSSLMLYASQNPA